MNQVDLRVNTFIASAPIIVDGLCITRNHEARLYPSNPSCYSSDINLNLFAIYFCFISY